MSCAAGPASWGATSAQLDEHSKRNRHYVVAVIVDTCGLFAGASRPEFCNAGKERAQKAVRQLGDPTFAVRETASKFCGNRGYPREAALKQAAESEDREVRTRSKIISTTSTMASCRRFLTRRSLSFVSFAMVIRCNANLCSSIQRNGNFELLSQLLNANSKSKPQAALDFSTQ